MEYVLNLRKDRRTPQYSAALDITYKCGPYTVEESFGVVVSINSTRNLWRSCRVFTPPGVNEAKDTFYPGIICIDDDGVDKCSLFIGVELINPYLAECGVDFCFGLLEGLCSYKNPLDTISAYSKQELVAELLRRSMP